LTVRPLIQLSLAIFSTLSSFMRAFVSAFIGVHEFFSDRN